ncbi:MAG: site-specific integrase [Terriglobia bacterium]|nr:site-specific integrase [Terriglobia bacterium]
MKRARYQQGSVVFDKRRKVWNFLFCENGSRRTRTIGALRDFPKKGDARRAAELLRNSLKKEPVAGVPTVATLIEQYRAEKMPKRYSTRRSYDVWLRLYVQPRWGASSITELQARPVELWLMSLNLTPRSRSSIRFLIGLLWDFAMWRGDVPTARNPMSLVTIPGASKRVRKPRSLTVEEFRRLLERLEEPFRTMALTCVCFGLRISETLGLKWSDVDWLNGSLRIQRSIVRQRVGETKTEYSDRALPIDAEMLDVLKAWKQETEFKAADDWVFASPASVGRRPYSADSLNDAYKKAGKVSGVIGVSTHVMRHTYRSWLDAVGTTVAVQQKLMRHADIRTTMNVYGDVVTDEMEQASSKVARLALSPLPQTDCGTDCSPS